MTNDELAIKALLDKHCIWNASTNIVDRVEFALRRLDQYTDELANLRLGLVTIEELTTCALVFPDQQ